MHHEYLGKIAWKRSFPWSIGVSTPFLVGDLVFKGADRLPQKCNRSLLSLGEILARFARVPGVIVHCSASTPSSLNAHGAWAVIQRGGIPVAVVSRRPVPECR